MAGTHEEVTDSKMLEKNISDPVPLQEFPPKKLETLEQTHGEEPNLSPKTV